MKFASFAGAVKRALSTANQEGEIVYAPPENPLSFKEFVTKGNPKYKWYPHCEKLCAVLQKVADGELDRVMIFMPPRHGKSELASKWFPAYYLYRYPDRWVGMSSYAADLSYTFSRAVRDRYLEAEGVLRKDAKGVKHWGTALGGGFWAAGVGGWKGKRFWSVQRFTG